MIMTGTLGFGDDEGNSASATVDDRVDPIDIRFFFFLSFFFIFIFEIANTSPFECLDQNPSLWLKSVIRSITTETPQPRLELM